MAPFNKSVAAYFANKQGTELGGELWAKIEEYRQYLSTSSQLVLWQNLYEAYYAEYWQAGSNSKSGSAGQFTNTKINQFKSILDRLQSVISQQRVKWSARATNSDAQSLKQTVLANELLDYYLRTKNLSELIQSTLNWGFLTGEGFLSATWDSQSGQIVAHAQEDDGSTIEIHEGDVRSAVFDPTCVVRDPTASSWDACDWVITIEQRNKYDEAAKYPELGDELIAMSLDSTNEVQWHFQPNWWTASDDVIAVYHFYHKKTPACPAGRYVKFYSSELVVIDTGLPYECIPVYRFAPQEHLGTCFGYSVAANLLPIQQTYDIITDTIATNHEVFGVQSVAGFRGSDLQWQQLANGMSYIEVDPISGVADPFPRALNLLKVSPDSYSYQSKLETEMQLVSGINSVARGQPPEGVTAGTALALIQSMAIQTNMPAQLRYVTFLERLGSGYISILREYAQTSRIAEVAGKDNKSFVKEFSSKDLNKVQRVLIELGNPLTDTVAGRVSVASDLLQQKLITTPQQYLTVINTGNLDPLTQGDQAELLLIRKENEMLSDGKPAIALQFDAHELHINEHKSVLADPELRTNDAFVQNVVAHIQQHQNFLNPPPPPSVPGAPPGPPAPSPGPQPMHPAAPLHPPMGKAPGQTASALSNPATAAGATAQLAAAAHPAVSPLEKKA